MVAANTMKEAVYKPLSDMVIIEKIDRPAGLIAIPDGSVHDEDLGRVIAVGPGRWNGTSYDPMPVQEGDVVSLLSDYPFGEVLHNKKKRLMIRAAYLKCKVEGVE